MAEVIEHVPRPPHLVFADLKECLRPGGTLVITTPNLYRFRNRVRMALGQPIFDHFRYPQMDRPLGHFLEYSREQIEWHLREAGFEIRLSRLDQLDYGGASAGARLARQALRPLLWLRPLWRDSLVFLARRPGG
jgi:2-polyprenyl-3-methyl-5-hydroxy-6-metoxy-1,4-benzoquinol methylase